MNRGAVCSGLLVALLILQIGAPFNGQSDWNIGESNHEFNDVEQIVHSSSNNSTNDIDLDGVPDGIDSCNGGFGNWTLNSTTDYDSDGCLSDDASPL